MRYGLTLTIQSYSLQSQCRFATDLTKFWHIGVIIAIRIIADL